jgi:PPOX class probable FMN-dependent enzyme
VANEHKTEVAGMIEVKTAEELRALVGPAMKRSIEKERNRLHAMDRAWLAASPFCLVATSNADGDCDVSPKGDPPGFAHVIDARTLALPERPGNRRVDGFQNILTNPRVGLIFFIPGRNDTLRINGRARLVRDAPFFDAMVVKGHRPILALDVEIDEIFHHCAKAFLRSDLWTPETWHPDALPSHAKIVKTVQETDMTLEELEVYYGPSYVEKLYMKGLTPER